MRKPAVQGLRTTKVQTTLSTAQSDQCLCCSLIISVTLENFTVLLKFYDNTLNLCKTANRNRQNNDLYDKWKLNKDLKYCRMLPLDMELGNIFGHHL